MVRTNIEFIVTKISEHQIDFRMAFGKVMFFDSCFQSTSDPLLSLKIWLEKIVLRKENQEEEYDFIYERMSVIDDFYGVTRYYNVITNFIFKKAFNNQFGTLMVGSKYQNLVSIEKIDTKEMVRAFYEGIMSRKLDIQSYLKPHREDECRFYDIEYFESNIIENFITK